MPRSIGEQLSNTVIEMLSGQLTDADAALAYLVNSCAEMSPSAQ